MSKVSIIIPVFRVEQYIGRCLDSILAQTLTDFEVLLIDDGSPDNSGKICDEYAAKDNRFKAFHKENGGVSSARNMGIQESDGDYLVFIDPDDLLIPNSLIEIVVQLENSYADIACARAYKFHQLGEPKKEEIFNIPANYTNRVYDGINLYINGNGLRGAVWGNVFKAEFVKKNNLLFVEGMANGEDSLFMANCYICNPKVLFVDKDYYLFYQREGSATHSWNENRLNRCINNIKYFIKELCCDNKDLYYYMLNQQIYSTISSLFYNLNFCYSHTLRRQLCRKVDDMLKDRKLEIGPIKRDKFKICVLNISVILFSILSRMIYRIRLLYHSNR